MGHLSSIEGDLEEMKVNVEEVKVELLEEMKVKVGEVKVELLPERIHAMKEKTVNDENKIKLSKQKILKNALNDGVAIHPIIDGIHRCELDIYAIKNEQEETRRGRKRRS